MDFFAGLAIGVTLTLLCWAFDKPPEPETPDLRAFRAQREERASQRRSH